MIKKIISNIKITFALLIIAIIVVWYVDGFDAVKELFTEYWFIWVLLPFVLRIWNWYRNLNQKAFDYGADTSGLRAEKFAFKKDKNKNFTSSEYEKLKLNAQYSKAEAARIRDTHLYENLALQKTLKDSGNEYLIPLYRYKSGLPGQNFIRPSELKSQFTTAKMASSFLEFYSGKPEDLKITSKQKFSEIPLASIIKIEVIDLVKNRQINRVAARVTKKVFQSIVTSVSNTGTRVTESNVDGAKIIIHYVTLDGVIMPATFIVNSGNKLGVKAIENLQQLSKKLKNYSFIKELSWENSILSDTSFTEDSIKDNSRNEEEIFDIKQVTSFLGDTVNIIRWVNLLDTNDSAPLVAKISAEMIASVLGKKDLELEFKTEQ